MKNEKYIAHLRASGEQQSLADHLSGVGRLCGESAEKLGLGKNGELIGLLHDFVSFKVDLLFPCARYDSPFQPN